MLKVGLTGGIGAGKSTIGKIFETLGIPVYDADNRAKMLMQEDEQVRNRVINIFGADAYSASGKLKREYLSSRVFHDKDALLKLNDIVHPAVAKDFDVWSNQKKGVPFVIKEAALIFEVGADKQLDKVIVVSAPEPLRVARIMERDNVEEAAVRARMANQLPEKEKESRADFLLYNNEKLLMLPQVMKIHQQLLNIQG